jgi:hypothetical protein
MEEEMLRFVETEVEIGLRLRKPTLGPELKLVDKFVQTIIQQFSQQGNNLELAIFAEPSLLSGYPDIVLAYYKPENYLNWSQARLSLKDEELKVLHHLSSQNVGQSETTLVQNLGYPRKKLSEILYRLHSSEMLHYNDNLWLSKNTNQLFGITDLIAVEAKINNWQSVLAQAQQNRWFASQSYILTPNFHLPIKNIEQAKRFGVGIYAQSPTNVCQELLGAKKELLPRCYTSWLFNEWIGRKIASKGVLHPVSDTNLMKQSKLPFLI